VLLINEFDFDAGAGAAMLFQKNYLAIPQNGAEPITFDYIIGFPSNTGLPSGFDLDNDGTATTQPGSRAYGGDSLGFGEFPGQYGFVIFSQFPIDASAVRTFQQLLWRDLPGATLPTNADGSPWYSEQEMRVLRLSSKNHVDVPVRIGGETVHVLASHPTPPAFDGPEDRNGKRNRDEIAFWALYLNAMEETSIKPSGGNFCSTLSRSSGATVRPLTGSFVIMGDLNADPNDGGSIIGAIQQVLEHPRVNTGFTPRSDGAAEAAQLQGEKNLSQSGDPQFDTADFSDEANGPGNLRADYVLASNDMQIKDGGVFWPVTSDPLARLVQMQPTVATSDHRLVWIDVSLPRR
jgi:3-phytase